MSALRDALALVTGGAGFIGSHLVERLVKMGARVRVVDNLITGRRENLAAVADRIEFVEGDLRNPGFCTEALRGVRNVFHLAALPSVPRSIDDPLSTHEHNATATLNLLLAARDAKVDRFVYAGSSSAYGNAPDDCKHESLPPRPLSPYAASKLAAEHYVQAFGAAYGLPVITLRYFNVFGPRQDPESPYAGVVPNFIACAYRGVAPYLCGDGSQSRDFTYVENVVEANILALDAGPRAHGQIYNIACGTSCTVSELLAHIDRIFGIHSEPHTRPARPGDVHHSRADIARARRDLGYEPVILLEEGLRRTIDWYRETRRDADMLVEGRKPFA